MPCLVTKGCVVQKMSEQSPNIWTDRQMVGWTDRQMWWFWYFPPPPQHCYGGWVKTTALSNSSWESNPALPVHFFMMNSTRSCSPECWQRRHDRFHTASCLLWASGAPQREFPSSLMAGGPAWRCPVGTEATGWAATRNRIQHDTGYTGYNMILATQDTTWYWLHRIQHDDDTGYTGYNMMMILATQDTTWWWYRPHRIQHDTGYTGYNMMMIPATQDTTWYWLHRIQHDDDTGYTGSNMMMIPATQDTTWYWLHRIQHDDDTGYTGSNMILATQDTTWYWLHRTHDTGYNIWWYKTDSVFSSYVTLNYSFYCPYFSVSWNAACIHQNCINVCSWQD